MHDFKENKKEEEKMVPGMSTKIYFLIYFKEMQLYCYWKRGPIFNHTILTVNFCKYQVSNYINNDHFVLYSISWTINLL